MIHMETLDERHLDPRQAAAAGDRHQRFDLRDAASAGAQLNGPDGLEERTADAQERSWAEDERIDADEDRAEGELMDVRSLAAAEIDLGAQISRFGDTALRIKLERDQAHAALKDIVLGADMMLQPALQWPGSVRHYIEEVRRVATQGLLL